jgi:GT2 family glycosyltransferase
MRVAVVIVNFHAGEVLAETVRRAMLQPEVAELVVVDNGSAPGEVDAALAGHDARRVRRLDLPENPGFAVACNRGVKLTESPWILFLNPDCWLPEHCLSALAKVAMPQSVLGVLGAALIDRDGHPDPASMRRDPSPLRAIATATGLDRYAWRWPWLQGIALPMGDNEAPRRVDAISGALMLVRREAFHAVGGFDEGYFMHAEDLDLCRRVRGLGFEVWCAPAVRVLHLKGVSSRRRRFRVAYAKHRSMLRYFEKFDALALAWPWRVLIRMGAWSRLLIELGRAAWPPRPA